MLFERPAITLPLFLAQSKVTVLREFCDTIFGHPGRDFVAHRPSTRANVLCGLGLFFSIENRRHGSGIRRAELSAPQFTPISGERANVSTIRTRLLVVNVRSGCGRYRLGHFHTLASGQGADRPHHRSGGKGRAGTNLDAGIRGIAFDRSSQNHRRGRLLRLEGRFIASHRKFGSLFGRNTPVYIAPQASVPTHSAERTSLAYQHSRLRRHHGKRRRILRQDHSPSRGHAAREKCQSRSARHFPHSFISFIVQLQATSGGETAKVTSGGRFSRRPRFLGFR
jgi:hypothetical protein